MTEFVHGVPIPDQPGPHIDLIEELNASIAKYRERAERLQEESRALELELARVKSEFICQVNAFREELARTKKRLDRLEGRE